MNEVELESTEDGVLLAVRAQPKARRNALAGVHDGWLRVQVTQIPEKGKANAAIQKVLAKSLGLKRSQIALHSGDTSTTKLFLVTGVNLAELRERITDGLALDS